MVAFGLMGCATPKARPRPPLEAARHSRIGFFDLQQDGALASLYRSSNSRFQWPLRGVEVTSPFGQRGSEFHEGIDLRAKAGTSVYASQSGIVLYADSRIRGYGKMVVIRHEPQVATLYAHNSKLLVHRGQRIRKGQLIAKSGQTGHVTGPHVHFEIRHGVTAVDPQRVLPKPQKRLRLG